MTDTENTPIDVEEDPFTTPATSSFVNWEDVNGRLVVLEVEEFVKAINTVHGENDAIRADLHVLDGDEEIKGQSFEGTLIFGKTMIPQLKKRVGKMVVARVGQGAKQKGKNAPWVLNDPTPEDMKVARAWLAARRVDPFA